MSDALETWRRKLAYLQQQEAVAADPAQKFGLAEQIAEAKAKIAELQVGRREHGGEVSAAIVDIFRIIPHAAEKLIGRDDELKLLNETLASAISGRNPARTFSPSSPSAARGRPRASGLARVRRRLRVVVLQPGHARAGGRFVRPVSQGSPHLLRRRRGQSICRQQRGRVRERPTPRPHRGPATQPPHPRRPRAAAIRAHLAHAGPAQGPGHRRAAQGTGRRQPRPLRRHHPVFAPGLAGVLADHRAGGEAAAPVPRSRRASAEKPSESERKATRRRNSRRSSKT